jgi:hypothetical protein
MDLETKMEEGKMKKSLILATVLGIGTASLTLNAFDFRVLPKTKIMDDVVAKAKEIDLQKWTIIKGDIYFAKEEIVTEGIPGRGMNTFVKLTIRNTGPTVIRNIQVKMCILEFDENPAANTGAAPHRWTSEAVTLSPGEEYTFEGYRLSTQVYADEEMVSLHRHYKAEIIAEDAIEANNTIVREVDDLNRVELF